MECNEWNVDYGKFEWNVMNELMERMERMEQMERM